MYCCIIKNASLVQFCLFWSASRAAKYVVMHWDYCRFSVVSVSSHFLTQSQISANHGSSSHHTLWAGTAPWNTAEGGRSFSNVAQVPAACSGGQPGCSCAVAPVHVESLLGIYKGILTLFSQVQSWCSCCGSPFGVTAPAAGPAFELWLTGCS